MAGKNTGVSTWSKGAIKFSGLPSPLDETEPQTCRQIIQYSYFLINTCCPNKILEEKVGYIFWYNIMFVYLPILSCDNINVKCTKENCQTKHIICTCPLTKKPTKKYEDIPTNSFNIICSGWFFPFLLIFSKWWNRGL